ncbi:MAG: hypothetical protein ACRDCB_07985 [Clostridium sp.]
MKKDDEARDFILAVKKYGIWTGYIMIISFIICFIYVYFIR